MKEDVINAVRRHLSGVASPFLLKRALSVIEESSEDKESLIEACGKVSRIVALFIDVLLAESISRDLRNALETSALKHQRATSIEKCLN